MKPKPVELNGVLVRLLEHFFLVEFIFGSQKCVFLVVFLFFVRFLDVNFANQQELSTFSSTYGLELRFLVRGFE